MDEKNLQKQVLFYAPMSMYNAINYYRKGNGMTIKGLMHRLINSFINTHQDEIDKYGLELKHTKQE